MDDYILKVPKGNSIGMSRELYEHLLKEGRIELYGEIRVPGLGTVAPEDD